MVHHQKDNTHIMGVAEREKGEKGREILLKK